MSLNSFWAGLQATEPSDIQFNTDKLIFVRNIVTGFCFKDESVRNALMPLVVDVLKKHIQFDGQQRSLTITIVNDLLNVVQLEQR